MSNRIVNRATPGKLEPEQATYSPFVTVVSIDPDVQGSVIVYHPEIGVISKNGIPTGRSL